MFRSFVPYKWQFAAVIVFFFLFFFPFHSWLFSSFSHFSALQTRTIPRHIHFLVFIEQFFIRKFKTFRWFYFLILLFLSFMHRKQSSVFEKFSFFFFLASSACIEFVIFLFVCKEFSSCSFVYTLNWQLLVCTAQCTLVYYCVLLCTTYIKLYKNFSVDFFLRTLFYSFHYL